MLSTAAASDAIADPPSPRPVDALWSLGHGRPGCPWPCGPMRPGGLRALGSTGPLTGDGAAGLGPPYRRARGYAHCVPGDKPAKPQAFASQTMVARSLLQS